MPSNPILRHKFLLNYIVKMSLVSKEGTPLLPLEAKHKVKICNGNIQ